MRIYCKVFIIICLIRIHLLYPVNIITHADIGIGPAWNSFISDTRFDFKLSDSVGKNVLGTDLELAAWLAGRIRTDIGNHFFVELDAEGGWVRKGRGWVKQDIIEPPPLPTHFSEFDINMKENIFTLYPGIAVQFSHNDFRGALLAGFTLRSESRHFAYVQLPNIINIQTTWKGAYLGAEAALIPCDCTKFIINYKLTLGNAHSHESRCIDKQQIKIKEPFFIGNNLRLEGIYTFSDHWYVGMNVTYSLFNSAHQGCVTLPPIDQATQTNARLVFLRSILLTWTGFIGASY